MKTPVPTMNGLCAMFKCTPEQVANQYAKNIHQLETILATAKTKAGKYRGFTATQWGTKIAKFKATAKAVCGS